MSITVSPREATILIALRAFLVAALPEGTEVIEGQDNRVPEPAGDDFVVMTPLRRPRLATNIDDLYDVAFTASMAGTAMPVSAVAFGTIIVGREVFGVDVEAGTIIEAQASGTPGGVGVYTISEAQTVASRKMAAGGKTITQQTQMAVQLDLHSNDLQAAGDMAAKVSTLFRDEFAIEAFHAVSEEVTPLFAGDPRQLPFVNEAKQYESRWVVDVEIQANQTIALPQQFADVLELEVVSVEAEFPPS